MINLFSGDAETRRRALTGLTDYDMELLQPGDIIPLLSDEEPLIRRLAIVVLAELNDIAAIPALLDVVANPDAELAEAASAALLEFRTRDAVDSFIAGVAHPSPRARRAAVAALRVLRSSRAVPALRKAIEDSSPDVRREAVSALGRLPVQGLPGILRPALHDSDDEVRRQVIAALALSNDSGALAPLVRGLRDRAWKVRGESAGALAKFSHKAAVLALRRALHDPETPVVRAAIESLGRLRAPVESGIVDFLNHDEPALRIAAVIALGNIGNTAFRFRLSMLLDDRSHEVVGAVIKVLARMDASELQAA